MGSQSKSKIPVIDLSRKELKPKTPTWTSMSNDVRCAFEEWGCFEAIYDKSQPEILNNIYAEAEELFNLPLETKVKNISNKPFFTYFGQYKTIPLYESLGIDRPTSPEATQSFVNLMWPNGNHSFCQTSLAISKTVVDLDRLVMKMLCESYGVMRFYDYYTGSTNYFLRHIRYTVPQADQTKMGLIPHSGKTLISIIHENHVNGLQVKNKAGEWADVGFSSSSSFIVMAGDALTAWSNDRIPACYHQVIMNATETRYSLGLFSFIDGFVHIPEKFGDDSQPLKYKSFDYFGFLHFSASEEGKKTMSPIKAYCGV